LHFSLFIVSPEKKKKGKNFLFFVSLFPIGYWLLPIR